MADQLRPLLEDLEDVEGEWQQLLDTIEITDVPLQMLKVFRVLLEDGTKFVFPIRKWFDTGMQVQDIEKMINEWFAENESSIVNTEFVIDYENLKDTVTSETNKILKGL